jgi:hypothetical protein
MKSDNLPSLSSPSREQHRPRAYVAPAVARISPREARELLLRNADANDPAVRCMLDRIEEILGRGAREVKI